MIVMVGTMPALTDSDDCNGGDDASSNGLW